MHRTSTRHYKLPYHHHQVNTVCCCAPVTIMYSEGKQLLAMTMCAVTDE